MAALTVLGGAVAWGTQVYFKRQDVELQRRADKRAEDEAARKRVKDLEGLHQISVAQERKSRSDDDQALGTVLTRIQTDIEALKLDRSGAQVRDRMNAIITVLMKAIADTFVSMQSSNEEATAELSSLRSKLIADIAETYGLDVGKLQKVADQFDGEEVTAEYEPGAAAMFAFDLVMATSERARSHLLQRAEAALDLIDVIEQNSNDDAATLLSEVEAFLQRQRQWRSMQEGSLEGRALQRGSR